MGGPALPLDPASNSKSTLVLDLELLEQACFAGTKALQCLHHGEADPIHGQGRVQADGFCSAGDGHGGGGEPECGDAFPVGCGGAR